MENPPNKVSEQPKPNRPYFETTNLTKEFLAAKRFTEKYIDTGVSGLDLSDTPENIVVIREYIEKLGNRLMPGIVVEDVIAELKQAGVVSAPVVEKVKKEKSVEFIQTEYVSLEKPKQVEIEEDQSKILEANLLLEEMAKANIFKNDEELDGLYDRVVESQKNTSEAEEYYYEFSKAGLIRGGDEEVQKDLESLNQRKNDFSKKEVGDTKQEQRLERAKKVATLTERALAEGVSKLAWYGDNISIEPASEFDDIKRGVDDILEIRKEDEESSFMGLGIDVTFRGLYSEQFKQKFFTLLQSIRDGYKTKVKYFKNHKGEVMKEFAIPKIVLYFNVDDVRDMVEILKHADNPAKQAELKNSPQKVTVMNQIIHSCDILATFAEESENNIFRKYVAVVNSIKEQAWENPDLREMLDTSGEDDEVSKQLKVLVGEFKLIDMQKNVAA